MDILCQDIIFSNEENLEESREERGEEMSPTGSLSLYSKHLTPILTLHSKHKFAYLTLQEVYGKSKQRFQSQQF